DEQRAKCAWTADDPRIVHQFVETERATHRDIERSWIAVAADRRRDWSKAIDRIDGSKEFGGGTECSHAPRVRASIRISATTRLRPDSFCSPAGLRLLRAGRAILSTHADHGSGTHS